MILIQNRVLSFAIRFNRHTHLTLRVELILIFWALKASIDCHLTGFRIAPITNRGGPSKEVMQARTAVKLKSFRLKAMGTGLLCPDAKKVALEATSLMRTFSSSLRAS